MASPRFRKSLILGVVITAALALAGCAASGGERPATDYAGVPAEFPTGGADNIGDGTPHALWVQDGARLAVVTYGSSSCPFVGESLRVVAPAGQGNIVRVTLSTIPPNQMCTADFGPHTTEFLTPANITTTESLRVDIDGVSVDIPPLQ